MDTRVIFSLLLCSLLGQVLTSNPHGRHRGMSKEHIRDELHGVLPENEYEGTNLESEESMELHYFKLHDYDKNHKLDGLELGAAMTHFHNDDGDDGKPKDKHIDLTDQEYFELIAQILKDDDLNDDGYVDFYEFMKAQSRNLPNTDPEDNIVP